MYKEREREREREKERERLTGGGRGHLTIIFFEYMKLLIMKPNMRR